MVHYRGTTTAAVHQHYHDHWVAEGIDDAVEKYISDTQGVDGRAGGVPPHEQALSLPG